MDMELGGEESRSEDQAVSWGVNGNRRPFSTKTMRAIAQSAKGPNETSSDEMSMTQSLRKSAGSPLRNRPDRP